MGFSNLKPTEKTNKAKANLLELKIKQNTPGHKGIMTHLNKIEKNYLGQLNIFKTAFILSVLGIFAPFETPFQNSISISQNHHKIS